MQFEADIEADIELCDFNGMFADSRERTYANTRPYPAGKKVIIRRSDVLSGSNSSINETIERINASIGRLKKVVLRTVNSPDVFSKSTFRDDEFKVATLLTDMSGGSMYIRNIHINPTPNYGFTPKCNYYVVVYENRSRSDEEITIVSADQLTLFF